MDNSGNFYDIMFQYAKNIQDYNENMRIYLEIISNRDRFANQQGYYNRQRYSQRFPHEYPEYLYTSIPLDRSDRILSNLLNPGVRRSRENVRRSRESENILQDVIVRPTQQQIQDATEIIIFDERNSNNNTNCPITLEPFVIGEQICRIKHCSHLFKQRALHDWFRRNVRCPVCRYDIRDYIVSQHVDANNNNNDHDNNDDNNDNNDDNNDNNDSDRENDILIEELLNEVRPGPRTRAQTSFTHNLTNAIRSFVNNELSTLSPNLNSVASELLYTFDIPLSFDVSGNMRI
jgi:hypothetical protein